MSTTAVIFGSEPSCETKPFIQVATSGCSLQLISLILPAGMGSGEGTAFGSFFQHPCRRFLFVSGKEPYGRTARWFDAIAFLLELRRRAVAQCRVQPLLVVIPLDELLDVLAQIATKEPLSVQNSSLLQESWDGVVLAGVKSPLHSVTCPPILKTCNRLFTTPTHCKPTHQRYHGSDRMS